MNKRPFDYSVSLRLIHPTIGPLEMAEELDRQPKYSWALGEPRRTPKGTVLPGVRKQNYCSFDLVSGSDGELAKSLLSEIDLLKKHREFLHTVYDLGGSAMLYVFWYPNGDTGEVFSVPLLRDLADLRIEIGLNVYDDRGAE